jgi:exopolysaccharide biosynthesis WecB/TagA/CpsF family protein
MRRKVNVKAGREMIVGADSPSPDYDRRPDKIERMVVINESKANVLLVGLGGDRQEKFIMKHRHQSSSVKTFLPLGRTFDYEAGPLRRPPSWITNTGLEWLYRVVREPRQRWHRYPVHQPPVLYHLAMQRFGQECFCLGTRRSGQVAQRASYP